MFWNSKWQAYIPTTMLDQFSSSSNFLLHGIIKSRICFRHLIPAGMRYWIKDHMEIFTKISSNSAQLVRNLPLCYTYVIEIHPLSCSKWNLNILTENRGILGLYWVKNDNHYTIIIIKVYLNQIRFTLNYIWETQIKVVSYIDMQTVLIISSTSCLFNPSPMSVNLSMKGDIHFLCSFFFWYLQYLPILLIFPPGID